MYFCYFLFGVLLRRGLLSLGTTLWISWFLLLFILLILGATFAIAYVVGKKYGRSRAIALALVSSQKNATLAIVIGELVLGPMALPALIANLVGQNIFLFPARAALHFVAKEESSIQT